MRLRDKIKTDKINKVVFDETFKVKFHLKFLHKSELQKLTALYTKKVVNPVNRGMEEEVDVDKLRKHIYDHCVVGWEGVTLGWINTRVPLDITDEEKNIEIEFSKEALEDLSEHIYGLDAWIFDAVKDAANFQDEIEKSEIKN